MPTFVASSQVFRWHDNHSQNDYPMDTSLPFLVRARRRGVSGGLSGFPIRRRSDGKSFALAARCVNAYFSRVAE
jgi:hypothetical protein